MMIMKKIFNSLFVIIASMITFAGCAKQEVEIPVSETKTIQFFTNSIETKTEFGTPDNGVYPTLWSAGDKVKILVNLEAVKNTEKTATIECSEDFKYASFVSDLAQPDATTFTFYSISPSVALIGKTTEKLYVSIPTEQEPLSTSVDKTAQVLYAVSGTTEIMPSSVELTYRHLTAYGKFSLANLTPEVTSVSSIKIEAPAEMYLAGKWDYFVADGSFAPRSGNGSASITIKTDSKTDIWFACAPIDVSEKTLTLTVTTDKGDLVKDIRFPANRKFEAGKIAKFTVDMTGIEVEEPEEPEQPDATKYYEKVTSALVDWSGKYLIVYESEENAYVFNGKDAVNGYVSATISENKIASTSDIDDVAVIVEPMSGGYAIKTSAGYIYGDSGANRLSFDANKKLNTIEYSSNEVTITSGRVLRFNSASNQMRFRYYTSGTQASIQLYRLVAGAEGGETPEPGEPEIPVEPTLTPRNLTFSAATATATVGQAFTAPTLDGEKTGVTYSSSNTAVATVNASTGAVTLVAAGTTIITATAPATDEYEAGTASYTLTVNAAQGGGQQTTTTYTFNSKSWGDSTKSWTSGKDGNQLTSGQGVQVTTGVSGANATCKNSFSNVSTVVVKYCTNASKGAGTIKVTIGSVTKTFTVSKSGGTSLRNATFDFNGATGTPKIEVTCTTNSIYVNAISITHTN